MTTKDPKKAAADIAILVPHLRQAAAEAQRRAGADSKVQFAIVAKRPDGSGEVGASFDCAEFLDDMETVFPFDEQAKLEAAAVSIVHRAGGRSPTGSET